MASEQFNPSTRADSDPRFIFKVGDRVECFERTGGYGLVTGVDDLSWEGQPDGTGTLYRIQPDGPFQMEAEGGEGWEATEFWSHKSHVIAAPLAAEAD